MFPLRHGNIGVNPAPDGVLLVECSLAPCAVWRALGRGCSTDHAVRLMPVPDSFVCPISAAIMVDPVATVDGSVYERNYIERWFREKRQEGNRITSPITGLELPSATLMPLVALQRAIEAYLAHRPELKREQMAGRSFEEAAQILQTDLFEKQAAHASTQDKLKRLKQANKALLRALHEAEERILPGPQAGEEALLCSSRMFVHSCKADVFGSVN
eukprot:s3050_g6.t1